MQTCHYVQRRLFIMQNIYIHTHSQVLTKIAVLEFKFLYKKYAKCAFVMHANGLNYSSVLIIHNYIITIMQITAQLVI